MQTLVVNVTVVDVGHAVQCLSLMVPAVVAVIVVDVVPFRAVLVTDGPPPPSSSSRAVLCSCTHARMHARLFVRVVVVVRASW